MLDSSSSESDSSDSESLPPTPHIGPVIPPEPPPIVEDNHSVGDPSDPVERDLTIDSTEATKTHRPKRAAKHPKYLRDYVLD